MLRVNSLFPLFSQFAIAQCRAGYAVHRRAVILESQPTRPGVGREATEFMVGFIPELDGGDVKIGVFQQLRYA
jgi:hypothetical protein